MPAYIRLCLSSIRRSSKSSGIDFVPLSPETVRSYVPELPEAYYELAYPAQRSDVIAARILESYGGLFLDADIVCLSSMDTVFDRLEDRSFLGFRNAQDRIAVWAIAASPGHPVIRNWSASQSTRLLDGTNLEWNALGSSLLTDAAKGSREPLLLLDAAQTVQPIAWNHQASFFADQSTELETLERGWQPFVVLNNQMLAGHVGRKTEHELRQAGGALTDLLRRSGAWHRRLVIGLGSGRCGTTSLARLLSRSGVHTTHEHEGRLPWSPDDAQERLLARLRTILDRPGSAVGDVAFFYLRWVPAILDFCVRERIDVRFVCLRRDRNDTVNSYVGWVSEKNANHWMQHDGMQFEHNEWDECYPKYPPMPLEKAVGRYWNEYYEFAARLEAGFPDCFKVFDVAHLNSEEGVRAIADFVGAGPVRVDSVGIHENAYATEIPIYWINLDRCTDRAARMTTRLEGAGLPFTRIRAVDGSNNESFGSSMSFGDDVAFLARAGYPDRSEAISRAEFSCTASHIRAIVTAYTSGAPYALILEDDVMLPEDLVAELRFILARMPKGCCLIQLCCIGPTETLRYLYKQYVDTGALWMRRTRVKDALGHLGASVKAECNGTQAYLISRRAMQRIVERFWRDDRVVYPFPMDVRRGSVGAVADEFIYDFAGGEEDDVFVLTRPIVLWEAGPSEIHPDHVSEHQRAKREVLSAKKRPRDLATSSIPIFWINLDRSEARRERMVARLSRSGFVNHRVPAVDGDSKEELSRFLRVGANHLGPHEHRKRPITDRELACAASHVKAIRQAWSTGTDYALICEDDIELGLISQLELAALVERLPANCAILQLAVVPTESVKALEVHGSRTGNWFVRKDKDDPRRLVNPMLDGVRVYGAGAYLITRAGMRHVCETACYKHKLLVGGDLDHNAANLADRIVYRTASSEDALAFTFCRPLFVWEALDSELHPDHLPEHREARKEAMRCVLRRPREGKAHAFP